ISVIQWSVIELRTVPWSVSRAVFSCEVVSAQSYHSDPPHRTRAACRGETAPLYLRSFSGSSGPSRNFIRTKRMESVDLIIDARWIIPVEPDRQVLEHHTIVIRGGRIVALLPSAQSPKRFSAREHVQRPGHVLIPGLINAHTHAAMSLLRGVADDLPFDSWLRKRIFPLEQRFVSAEFVREGTELAFAEMLLAGTTCVGDWYFHPDESARVATELHVRACIGAPIADFPAPWSGGADDYLSQGLALHDAWRDHPLITTALGPHSPYLVSDATFERIRTYADQLDATVMIHLHESAAEIEQSLSVHGLRPIERLRRLGLLSPRLIAVHLAQAETADIATAVQAGLSVFYCPAT